MPKVIFIGDEERRLVKRLQEGDKSAAREFYALYADTMAGVCSRYIADEEDLKDVFQNAFIHIFTHIAEFKYLKAGSLEAWATKVVVNQSLKFLRSNQRHEFAPLCDDIADEPETDDPPISDVPPDAIHQMVSRLPTGYRTVFNLYVFEDHSHKEIARLLGISERTSASQLHRAKNLLAKMIQQYHNDKSPRR